MNKVILFLCLFCVFGFEIRAQELENLIDSLQRRIDAAPSDTARLNQTILIAREHQSDYFAVALHFGEKAVKDAYNLKQFERLGYALNLLGNVYWYMGDHGKAMEFYTNGMDVRDQIKDKRGSGTSRINIGSMLSENDDFKGAEKYFLEALAIFIEIGNKEEEAAVYINFAELYYYQKNYDSAALYYNKAEEITRHYHYLDQLHQVYNGKAMLMRRQDQLDSCIYLHKANIELANQLGDEYSLTSTLNNLSLAYAEKGDLNQAIATAIASIELCNKIESKTSLQYAYGNLSWFYKLQNKWELAYRAMESYMAIKEELEGEQTKQITREIEARFQDEKKQLEIENLTIENKVKQEELLRKQEESKNERMRSYMLAGGLIFMGALAFFIFRGLKESRRKNKIISEQKQEVEEQKFIIEEKNKEIIDSIHYAKNLQNAILPSKKTLDEAFENYFLFYQPKDIVAGDFYFLEKVKNDQQQTCVIAAAADSTGHGVPGAMVSVVCANALNRCVNEFGLTIPGEILDHTAQLIENTFGKSEREVRDGMDISLICYLPDSKKLYWSGANNPLWLIRNGALMEIKPDKQPVGKFELRQAFNTHELQLQSGDEIIMVTDGFADQFGGPGGKKFKNKQLQKLLLELNALSGIEKEQKLQQAFVAWKGSLEQVDDITLFGFKA